MGTPLRVLHLEDSKNDAELVAAALEDGGLDCAIALVDRRDTFAAALREGAFDVVLIDYRLPHFDGLSALELAKQIGTCGPAIVVSGTIGEESAVETLKRGAYDFVLKDQLPRLAPAVLRALDRARAEAARRQAEATLRAAYEGLEVRVRERTAELERLNQALVAEVAERTRAQERLGEATIAAEVANRAKSEFLAGMSHELRTPLGAILGFSELLAERRFGDLNAKQEEYVRDIMASGQHLLSLINDILDLSKVEAGKMELELSAVPIAPLVEGSLVMVKEKCLKHGITLAADIHPSVAGIVATADERRLKQILFNLLSNAAKFTPVGGAITIGARLSDGGAAPGPPDADSTATLEISVADTGIGVAPEHQEKIFGAFVQVPGSAPHKTPGTGLGLALAKRMVELYGGRIWVESEGAGQGSTFRFTLPLAPPRAVNPGAGSVDVLQCEKGTPA